MLGRLKTGPRRIPICAHVEVAGSDGGNETVVIADPAIEVDHEDTDLEKFRESQYDMKHVHIFKGQTPTWFTVEPLTRRQKDAAEHFETSRQRSAFMIRCSVVRVEGYKIKRADGSEYDLDNPSRKKNGQLGMMAKESWIDRMDLPELYLIALGHQIKRISEASHPLSKPSVKPVGGMTSESEESEG